MNKRIFALGFFDGVHRGHQVLLAECRRLAREHGYQAGAVTFGTHPEALTAGHAPAMISTPRDREALLKAYQMDTVVTLPFDEALRSMSWVRFLLMLQEQYGAAGFVCGDDFRFGYRGQGTAALLKEYCDTEWLPCAVVPEQTLDEVRISSTYIRRQIEQGDMDTAVRFLGHGHMLTGEVVSGRKLGHRLGFPTANIEIPMGIVCPRHGVYACRAYVDGQRYMAVSNVGSRPTVEGHQVRTETWLLDFDGDLYGRSLTLEFLYFLRPEQRFESLDALKKSVLEDADHTREFFRKKEEKP